MTDYAGVTLKNTNEDTGATAVPAASGQVGDTGTAYPFTAIIPTQLPFSGQALFSIVGGSSYPCYVGDTINTDGARRICWRGYDLTAGSWQDDAKFESGDLSHPTFALTSDTDAIWTGSIKTWVAGVGSAHTPTENDVIENSGAIVVRRKYGRMTVQGTSIYCEQILYFHAGLNQIDFEFLADWSDQDVPGRMFPGTTATTTAAPFPTMTLSVPSPWLMWCTVQQRGITHVGDLGDGEDRWDVAAWPQLGDGQGITRVRGRLINYTAATTAEKKAWESYTGGETFAICHPDDWKGHAGPYGDIAVPRHPYVEVLGGARAGRTAAENKWSYFQTHLNSQVQNVYDVGRMGDPLFGRAPGNFSDFGMGKLQAALCVERGNPLWIAEHWETALSEMCIRPVHFRHVGPPAEVRYGSSRKGEPITFDDFRDATGSDFLYINVYGVWYSSPNKLGKSHAGPFEPIGRGIPGTGSDRQSSGIFKCSPGDLSHVGVNGLAALYLFSGSHMVRTELETWLAWYLYQRYPRSDSAIGISENEDRSGRGEQVAAWAYWCSKDATLRATVREVLEKRMDTTPAGGFAFPYAWWRASYIASDGDFAPIKYNRSFAYFQHDHWRAWETIMGAPGYYLAYLLTSDATWKQFVFSILHTWLKYGWWWGDLGDGAGTKWNGVVYIALPDGATATGQPPPPSYYLNRWDDKTNPTGTVKFDPGGDLQFDRGEGSVRLAIEIAELVLAGTPTATETAQANFMLSRGRSILRELYTRRRGGAYLSRYNDIQTSQKYLDPLSAPFLDWPYTTDYIPETPLVESSSRTLDAGIKSNTAVPQTINVAGFAFASAAAPPVLPSGLEANALINVTLAPSDEVSDTAVISESHTKLPTIMIGSDQAMPVGYATATSALFTPTLTHSQSLAAGVLTSSSQLPSGYQVGGVYYSAVLSYPQTATVASYVSTSSYTYPGGIGTYEGPSDQLRLILRDDIETILDTFGETITYQIGGSASNQRTILAVVFRAEVQPDEFGSQGLRKAIEVTIANRDDIGIDRPEEGDVIVLPYKLEHGTRYFRVGRIVQDMSDDGAWRLYCLGE